MIFRPEPLDIEPFELARTVLGPVVPDVQLLKDENLASEGIWAYWMTCTPGKTWLDGARGRRSQSRVTTGSSKLVIDNKLRPHLELLLSSPNERSYEFRDFARDLLGKLDWLQILPLFVSHFDLNDINILVDDNCEVSGLIDWELSTRLPFGMGFGRIYTLAGEYSDRKFHMPPEFEDAEKGFCEEVYKGIPAEVRKSIEENPDIVQIAVTLGTLLNAFRLDDDVIGSCNPVVIEALPKLLTYRIPVIRG
ncbi:hypothetical protein BU16DRAFT_552085 [Lophium mytilinum]|uniref:Aminoglycoside phosphotransferase domain-containing protein n=1 Tax=Lophium mytilinum TaxID=390894 RepID=A0A6A6QJR8_9PEZI|nr:hypothetical protein BU16DRAFT_552085 [Lophium mytilinum]